MKQKTKKQIIKDFEYIINLAKLKPLSRISLERPLTDLEYDKMMELKGKVM